MPGSEHRSSVARMLAMQVHRGPDGFGQWESDEVALGHRRLAIIDTSDAGAQPMLYGDGGRYVITYNGEIYNYIELRDELQEAGLSFSSECDTEVLLGAYAHWGRDMLSRLNGMFAFAIWDRVERRLFCARDRLGVKPFSYAWNGRRLAFASEQKALVAANVVSGEANPTAIYEYLARGYTSEGRSFHHGVEQLEPGCWLQIDDGGQLTRGRWWTPDRSPIDATSREEWLEQIAQLLDDAVRLRLRSDVPVGAHLSGGIDSSSVVAAASRHGGAEIHTFTGAFTDDAHSDERKYARAVSDMYKLTAHEVEIGIAELADQFDRIMWHMDEPIAGVGVFPQMLVCDLARRNGFIVVLGGQGGDELFAGYLRHRALHYRRQLKTGGPRNRGAAFLELASMVISEGGRVRRTSTRVGDERLSPAFIDSVDSAFREEVRRSRLSHGSARDLMWHDLHAYLPALLHVEDRTSMASSIESRTPMLDYRLVEASLRVPERLLFRRGDHKPLLRDAVAPWLPALVADRKDKRGFPTPLQYWNGHPRLSELVNSLTQPQANTTSAGELAVFSDEYLARRDHFQPSELWTVMTVQGWSKMLSGGGFGQPRQQSAV